MTHFSDGVRAGRNFANNGTASDPGVFMSPINVYNIVPVVLDADVPPVNKPKKKEKGFLEWLFGPDVPPKPPPGQVGRPQPTGGSPFGLL